jgi:hypothetical protein
VRSLIQQHQQLQQVQQQGSTQAVPHGSARPIVEAFTYARLVLHVWRLVIEWAPPLLPTVLSSLLPLVQQLQSCGRPLLLLPQRCWQLPSSGSNTSTEAGPSDDDDGLENINEAVFQFHEDASNLLFMLHVLRDEMSSRIGAAASQQISRLLQQPPVQQLLLQLLTSCIVMLHKDHTAHQQQHGAADQGSSSSSASRGRATLRPPSGQLRCMQTCCPFQPCTTLG